MNHSNEHRAAVILCGGKSTRMNYPKSLLPFGPELLIERILRVTRLVVNTQVVVSAEGQGLPSLHRDVIRATDQQPDRGPLEGISAGLQAVPDKIDTVFVTSCDVPLLSAEVIHFLFEQMDAESDIVVPQEERFFHPLLAVYRSSVQTEVRSLLSHDKLRPVFLFDRVRTKPIATESLRSVDPDLNCLRNLNHPDEYVECLTESGFELDPNVREKIYPHDSHTR